MRLRTLAGALALGVGAAALSPSAVQAADRGRDGRHASRVEVVQGSRYDRGHTRDWSTDYRRSYRDGRSDWSYRSYSRPFRSLSYSRPYRSRTYSYSYRPYYRSYGYAYPYYGSYYYDAYYDGYYGGYYGDYCDDGYYTTYYRRPRALYPSFRYYRPLLGVRVGGPHFGVFVGF